MHDAAIAWAQERLGRQVTSVTPLVGGRTSAMLALGHGTPDVAVLRLVTEEPWRTHGAELVLRESETQRILSAERGVPAPLTLATDPHGDRTGHPAHLMTLVPGSPDLSRVGDEDLAAMAGLLASIHVVDATPSPRAYQSWAWSTKWLVPGWAVRTALWRRAFDVLAGDPPPYGPRFLHRDFGPHNLLWADGEVTGVVDWVETSTGPAWLDVAHGATNLAVRHGSATGQRFAAAYTHLTGVEREPFWEVMDVVGFLPPPGRTMVFGRPEERTRLEEHLAWVLS